MSESYYWKENLKRSLGKLAMWQKQRRWSEHSICLFEREIIVTFFFIRKLIEDHKLTDKCRTQNLIGTRYRHVGPRVDISNRWKIEKLYNLGHGRKRSLSLTFVANQIIHNFIFITVRFQKGMPEGIMVSSDFKRNNHLYHFSLTELVRVIRNVAADNIMYVEMRRHSKTEDMEVVRIS